MLYAEDSAEEKHIGAMMSIASLCPISSTTPDMTNNFSLTWYFFNYLFVADPTKDYGQLLSKAGACMLSYMSLILSGFIFRLRPEIFYCQLTATMIFMQSLIACACTICHSGAFYYHSKHICDLYSCLITI